MAKVLFIFLFAVGLFHHSILDEYEELEESLQRFVRECKEEIQATDDDFEAMQSNRPNRSLKAQCLVTCTMKKLGLFDENGKTVHNLREIVDSLQIEFVGTEESLALCADHPVPPDFCEASVETLNCLIRMASGNTGDGL